MAKILQIALIFAVLHLTHSAPFSTDTFLLGSQGSISEVKISGTVVQAIPVRVFSDANLDSSGTLLGFALTDENGDGTVYTLDNAQKVTQIGQHSFSGASVVYSFTDVMINGNDTWINFGDSIRYGARGATQYSSIVQVDASTAQISSAQLVGDRIYILRQGVLSDINAIKTGTATVNQYNLPVVFDIVYFYDENTMYAFQDINLEKYTKTDTGVWTRAYFVQSRIPLAKSMCVVELGGVRYILIVNIGIDGSSVLRFTDTGSAIYNQITLLSDPIVGYQFVAPIPAYIPTCSDQLKNQDESDIDCGGTKCSKCGTDKTCGAASDCSSGVCTAGKCAAPTCQDSVQNGDETDVDCGGTCSGCALDKKCLVDNDCAGKNCADLVCSISCQDNIQNQDETDVDCGGSCNTCANGKFCLQSTDCTSTYCNGDYMCVTPTCSDEVKNQDESDIDCGGKCSKCALDKKCTANTDCLSNLCKSGVCSPSCEDSIKNQDETDVDCGGNICSPCADGKICNANTDCSSEYCNPDGQCSVQSCEDGYQNQDEVDIDCAGICSKCANGQNCNANTDCTSGYCNPNNRCADESCDDTWQNQDESDVDCGGLTCIQCAIGKKCSVNGDCQSNTCSGNVCVDAPVSVPSAPVSTVPTTPVSVPSATAVPVANSPTVESPGAPVASTPSRKLVSSANMVVVAMAIMAMVFIVLFM